MCTSSLCVYLDDCVRISLCMYVCVCVCVFYFTRFKITHRNEFMAHVYDITNH